MTTSSPTQRLHGLDALRAFALLLGVVLHAGMSFIPGIPIWIVQDSQAAAPYALTFYIPHIFRMVLFFVIAGFFARLAYEKRGALGFAWDRVKRIALPLASFWMPLFAGIVAAIIWAAVKANGGEMPEPQEQPPLTVSTFPLTHLWFLYLLCLFYPAAIILRLIKRSLDPKDHLGQLADGAVRLATATPLIAIFLALPLTLAFMSSEMWMMWFGIPTPDTGLLPNTIALTGYGTAFGFGWLLHRQTGLLQRFQAWWPAYLAMAVALTAICLNLAGFVPGFTPADDSTRSWLYAASYATASWSWTLGLMGAGLALFSRHNNAVRYVADASYWIYLLHLPLVMALQVWLSDAELPALVKFLTINVLTLAITIASYHLLVRYTWLGAWLNGRKHERPSRRLQAGASANA